MREALAQRFQALEQQAAGIRTYNDHGVKRVDAQPLYQWAASALHLVAAVFGQESPHYVTLEKQFQTVSQHPYPRELDAMRGAFLGAKSDFDGGYLFTLERAVSGEIFGDFVALAKAALTEGHHTVAAVLACAALEDALKRFATANGLDVGGKVMQEVVNALKSKGLVSGAQKSLLDAMPKIRDYAMHSEWNKITPQDAGSVVGFVEQFLVTNF